MDKKTIKTILIVLGIVVGVFVLYNVVRFLIAVSAVNKIQNEAREKMCCIDAGGMWTDNKCTNVQNTYDYSECMGK